MGQGPFFLASSRSSHTSSFASLQVFHDVVSCVRRQSPRGQYLHLRQLLLWQVGPIVQFAVGIHDQLHVGNFVVARQILREHSIT